MKGETRGAALEVVRHFEFLRDRERKELGF